VVRSAAIPNSLNPQHARTEALRPLPLRLTANDMKIIACRPGKIQTSSSRADADLVTGLGCRCRLWTENRAANMGRVTSGSRLIEEGHRMGVSLVTGANRGIGLELARQLKARGASVVAVCRQSSAELDALGLRVESGGT
jgi:hypothetical protein